MRAALKNPWYLASIGVILTAIAVDIKSKQYANLGMTTMAKVPGARHNGASSDVIESMHAKARAAAHQAGNLGLIGLVIAVAAGACFFISIQTHESRWDVIPIGLGLVYIGSFMLLI